jgi:protein-L-isoaspartate(D-aspartate) O-methyltransferase
MIDDVAGAFDTRGQRAARYAVPVVMVMLFFAGLGSLRGGGREGDAGDGPDWAAQRRSMVAEQIRARGVRDETVLRAMERVPRHLFVPEGQRSDAYRDHPLPIGGDQTISQPYIVAYMTAALGAEKGEKVLEIGTGSGYQAAVLAEMGVEVYTVEIVKELGERARALLEKLGYDVHARIGDGYAGWPEAAPFDGIIVTAAPPQIPTPLKEQLAEGGRMVIPVGELVQELKVMVERDGEMKLEDTLPVRFVPMTGKAADD